MESEAKASRQPSWDYIYEPDAQTVIDELLVRYAESMVLQAVARTWRQSMRHAWLP